MFRKRKIQPDDGDTRITHRKTELRGHEYRVERYWAGWGWMDVGEIRPSLELAELERREYQLRVAMYATKWEPVEVQP